MDSQEAKAQVAIESLLAGKIGLRAESMGSGTIARIIQSRLRACGLTRMHTYWERLQLSAQEVDALIEAVVVPETCFFRTPESFIFLQEYVRSEWRPANPRGVLRILSVPCSTGQEPYSIAIALLEAGLTPNQFEIQAIDISHQALTLAKRARYDSYSFRTPYPYNQQRYFYPRRGNQQLDASIQKLVQFRQGNLIDRLLQDPPSPYHIIFCRNLLIYLTPTARHQTMTRLEQWLSPTGLLFLGHAETHHVDKNNFTPVQYPLTFAFQRQTTPATSSSQQNFYKSSPTQTPAQSRLTNTQPDPTAPTLKQQAQYQWRQYQWIHKPWAKKQYQQPSISQSVTAASPRGAGETPARREIPHSTRSPAPRILPRPHLSCPSPPSLSRQSSLTTARAFADRGNFQIAASLCTAYLEKNPTSADAYLLRGEIYQAEGQPVAAETCFQRAIYLEPDCYEALLHLCLIKEQQGNRAGASVIRDRIQRVSERKSQMSKQST